MDPSNRDDVEEFLRIAGIEAVVLNTDGQNVITMSREQFLQRRDWIERWFILIRQEDSAIYLRERPRGTGDTR